MQSVLQEKCKSKFRRNIKIKTEKWEFYLILKPIKIFSRIDYEIEKKSEIGIKKNGESQYD